MVMVGAPVALGDDSDTELDCLPDLVGKYGNQGKPLGSWRPQAKKDFQPTSVHGINQYISRAAAAAAATSQPEPKAPSGHSPIASQHLLLKLLSERPSILLGGGAVRAGGAVLPSDCCRRAVREKLGCADHLKEKQDYFGALRWVISALGLCRSMRRTASAMQKEPTSPASPNPGIDVDVVERVVKTYKELRERVLAQLSHGHAVSSRPDLEERAQHHHAAGCAARERSNLETSLREFKEVLRLRIALVGEAHPDTALARSHVANVIRDLGNPKGAMVELRKALRIQEEALGEGHPHVGISRNNIGAVLKQQGKAEEALLEHRRALVILIRHCSDTNNKYISEVREHIGHALRIQGDVFGAVEEYEAALAVRRSVLGPNHPKTQRLMQKLQSLSESWTGPAKSMMQEMRARKIPEQELEWHCPMCGWDTKLNVCSCCSYRRPLSRAGVQQCFAGMVFAFTGILPKSVHPSAWREWQLAEQRGARCIEDVDESVTHLVYREGYERSGKVQQAQQLSIKVVLADWFYQSINIGLSLDETPFLAEVGSGKRIITKRLPHVRPGGGTERGQSCPPHRCTLAPPPSKGTFVQEKLPGPCLLIDPASLATSRLPNTSADGTAPVSPAFRKPEKSALDRSEPSRYVCKKHPQK